MKLYRGMLGRSDIKAFGTKSIQLLFNRKMKGKVIRFSGDNLKGINSFKRFESILRSET
jgi:hypothetical protein